MMSAARPAPAQSPPLRSKVSDNSSASDSHPIPTAGLLLRIGAVARVSPAHTTVPAASSRSRAAASVAPVVITSSTRTTAREGSTWRVSRMDCCAPRQRSRADKPRDSPLRMVSAGTITASAPWSRHRRAQAVASIPGRSTPRRRVDARLAGSGTTAIRWAVVTSTATSPAARVIAA